MSTEQVSYKQLGVVPEHKSRDRCCTGRKIWKEWGSLTQTKELQQSLEPRCCCLWVNTETGNLELS